MAWTLLLVEDERSVREAFALRLADHGYLVQAAPSGAEALRLVASAPPDVMVLDLVMPEMEGLTVLARVREIEPDLPVIVLTARGTVKDAVEAMRLGAYDFITKSIEIEDLVLALRRATELLTVSRQVRHQASQDAERYAIDRVIAHSPAMKALMKQVRDVARNDRVTVLLQGETGSGKQFLGRVIHWNGPRAGQPYMEVDCPAIPHELFESVLFGHEKGSFTGAAGRKRGLIEIADGGTLLFDEIGDLPLGLQAKLLRVIEERSVRRVGGAVTMPIDVRFMAATNRDLKDAVARGQFREDLYYRLNVVTLTAPPLRERREDLIPLAEHALLRSAHALKKPVRTLGESARALFQAYAFPGNIRELANLIERAVLFCHGPTLEAEHFPADLQAIRAPGSPAPPAESTADDPRRVTLSFRIGEQSLADLEDRIVNEVLQRAGDNKSLAAKHLGITRWTLDRRRKK
ncbi:MAG: sigma-54 dependent transcriptional regulator [Nitrospiria bacterium]